MLAPCTRQDEDACARKFITDFGLRAYRRPLATEEIDRLMALYQTGRTALTLELRRRHPAAGRSDAAVAGLPLPLGARLRAPARSRARSSASATTRSPRGCRTSSGARCPTGAVRRRRRQQAGHPGRDRGAGPAHAGRPQGARHRHRLRRGVAEPGSGRPSAPKDPMVYPEFKDDLKTAMDAEAALVHRQRGVRRRRQVRLAADGDQHLRQPAAGGALRHAGRHRHRDEAGDARRGPARGPADPRRAS